MCARKSPQRTKRADEARRGEARRDEARRGEAGWENSRLLKASKTTINAHPYAYLTQTINGAILSQDPCLFKFLSWIKMLHNIFKTASLKSYSLNNILCLSSCKLLINNTTTSRFVHKGGFILLWFLTPATLETSQACKLKREELLDLSPPPSIIS